MAVVYLTFDDGPIGGTDDIVAVLNNKQVKGTVFLVGDRVSTRFGGRVLDAAHSSRYVEIGNHSTTHADGRYATYYGRPADVFAGFEEATRTLRIAQRPVRARLPGRNTWRAGRFIATDPTNGGDSAAAADRLAAAGYRIYGWDDEWHRQNGRPLETVDQSLAMMRRRLVSGKTMKKDHFVLLTHDNMFRSSQGDRPKLERLIDALSNEGHSFAFISEFDGTVGG